MSFDGVLPGLNEGEIEDEFAVHVGDDCQVGIEALSRRFVDLELETLGLFFVVSHDAFLTQKKKKKNEAEIRGRIHIAKELKRKAPLRGEALRIASACRSMHVFCGVKSFFTPVFWAGVNLKKLRDLDDW